MATRCFAASADEGVQSAPDREAVLDRAGEKQDPLGGELAPGGRDTDEQGVRAQRQPLVERRHNGNVAAEADDVLRSAAGPCRVDDADHPLGRVADAGVGGF